MLALECRFDTFFIDNLVTGRDFAGQIDLETLNKILARELIMGSPREDFVFKLSVHLALLWIDLELSAGDRIAARQVSQTHGDDTSFSAFSYDSCVSPFSTDSSS